MKERITSPNPKTSVLAAIMPWKGMPGNTAIVSRRLVDSGLFTTLEIKKIEAILEEDEQLTDCPINTRKVYASKLDANGIVRLGETVTYGDVLIGKCQPREKINKDNPEERMLALIFGDKYKHEDTSARMPFKDSGVVIDIENTGKRITVYVLIKRELRVGDILRDDDGIQFAIAEIRETDLMPCIEVLSQMHVPDLLIVPPTKAKLSGGYFRSLNFFVMHSLTGPQQFLLRHRPERKKTKKWIVNGDTAEAGYIKIQKIAMLLEQKADAPKLETRYVTTNQIVQGHNVSAKLLKNLADNGLLANLRELLTAKSDNMSSYMKTLGTIMYGDIYAFKSHPGEKMTGSARMTIALLECLGFSCTIADGSLQLGVDPSDRLARLSSREVKVDSTKESKRSSSYDLATDALSDPNIFGKEDSEERGGQFGHIALPIPLLNPFNTDKMDRFLGALRDMRLDEDICEGKKSWNEAVRNIFSELGIGSEHVIDNILVLPLDMREASADIGWHYMITLTRITRLVSLLKRGAYPVIVAELLDSIQKGLNSLYGTTKNEKKGLLDLLVETNTGLFEKKVSFSAKSIVIADEKLAADECSIPQAIALCLFKPFVQQVLIKEEEMGQKGSERLVDYGDPEAVQALQSIAPELCVLLTTADQSKLSAFKVVIDPHCEVIKLNAEAIGQLGIQAGAKGKAYIHAPLSAEARTEAQSILFSEGGVKQLSGDSSIESSLLLNKETLLKIANKQHGGYFELSKYDKMLVGI